MKNKLIILSGGMDSVTLLYDQSTKIAKAITFDYGSKHNNKERVFAKYHCKKLGIEHLTIPLGFINKYFKSDLLKSGGSIPEGHYEDESMKRTVVPFRNGIMLSIAVGVAESNGLVSVLLANHAGDHAIYPDCRKSFIEAMDSASYEGTYLNVNIESPYLNIDKRGIALIGNNLGVDYSKTWTCYKGLDKHCGKCGSCTERKEALQGFDKTIYNENN
jgi:7-cyano-7-deazaguanine synthase